MVKLQRKQKVNTKHSNIGQWYWHILKKNCILKHNYKWLPQVSKSKNDN